MGLYYLGWLCPIARSSHRVHRQAEAYFSFVCTVYCNSLRSPFSPALKGRDESRGYVQRFPRCIARELQTSTRCSVVTLACDVHPALQVGAVGQKAWRLSLEHGVTAGVLRCAQWPASFAATGGCSWLLWLLING